MQEDNFDNNNDNMDMDMDADLDGLVYTLTDEDGNESDFELLGRYDLDGQSYVALAPVEADDGEEEDEGSFIVLKVVMDDDGEESFETIEDDEEFDKIADIFEDQLIGEDFIGDENADEENENEDEE